MNATQFILSRLLPKTGQETEYGNLDDGYYESGWWRGLSVANNKTRFLIKTLDGDDVVIDRATGLMWPKDFSGAGGRNGDTERWGIVCQWANELVFAGFSDWRLPNITELLSIVDYSESFTCAYEPPFINVIQANYWSSTTYIGLTTKAWYMQFATGDSAKLGKDTLMQMLAVRGGL